MTTEIYTCDVCKKAVKKEELSTFTIGYNKTSYYGSTFFTVSNKYDLCSECQDKIGIPKVIKQNTVEEKSLQDRLFDIVAELVQTVTPQG